MNGNLNHIGMESEGELKKKMGAKRFLFMLLEIHITINLHL